MQYIRTHKNDPYLRELMSRHYSQPRGFVGRQLCYIIEHDGIKYGASVWGSATKHLPGRQIIGSLNFGLSNLFFHIERVSEKYPFRNFATRCICDTSQIARRDYTAKYWDGVTWLETLVELPRTGECYRRAGWKLVGQTKGLTCKRIKGKGSDSWSGQRVWCDTNLRPKLVYQMIL